MKKNKDALKLFQINSKAPTEGLGQFVGKKNC